MELIIVVNVIQNIDQEGISVLVHFRIAGSGLVHEIESESSERVGPLDVNLSESLGLLNGLVIVNALEPVILIISKQLVGIENLPRDSLVSLILHGLSNLLSLRSSGLHGVWHLCLNILVGLSGGKSIRPSLRPIARGRGNHHHVLSLDAMLVHNILSVGEAADLLVGLVAAAGNTNVSELRVEEGFSLVSVVHHLLVDLPSLSVAI